MGGDVVGAEVEVNLCVGPVENGIDLEGFFLLLGEGSFGAGGGLAAAEARDPDIGAELVEGAVHGLDFVDHRVAFEIGLPKFAVKGFLAGGADAWGVGAEIDGPFFHEFFHVVVGLGKEVARIHKDDGDFRRVMVDEVNHNRGLQAKGSGRNKAISIGGMEKLEAIRSLEAGERSGEIWSGEHFWKKERGSEGGGEGGIIWLRYLMLAWKSMPCLVSATMPARMTKSPKCSPVRRSLA
jgi:hypothetical protein